MLTDEFLVGTKLYHKKFTELCKPMASYLGITHAIYINMDKHGKMFSVCTHTKWIERFLAEQYYQLDPFMVHPNNIHNGFAFDNASGEQEFKDTLLYDAVVNFNWCNSFAYIEKDIRGGYFGFDFGTSKHNYHIANKLINEAPIIKKMIRDLNKKLIILVKDFTAYQMDFSALKGDVFHTQKGLVFSEYHENKYKVNLLKELGFLTKDNGQDFLNKDLLSPQEINCLRIYLTTHSIKRVSRDLNLAATTVTSYIENIKAKLGCHNKNDLFEKSEILASFGHF